MATWTLTENTDVATADVFKAGQVFTPGGTDRINALQDEDVLTGAGANARLDATLGNANDNGGTIVTPKLVNISTVNVAFTGSGAAVTALDLQDATGVKEVNINRVSQAINSAEVGNIMDASVAKLSLSDTNANHSGTVEFSFAQDALKGANTGALNVSNVGVGTLNIGENTSGIAARGVGLNGYEQITINSTGARNTIGTVNLPMDTGTDGKITLTGDKALTLATTNNIIGAAGVEAVTHAGGIAQAQGRLATIDGSAMTAGLTLNVGNALLSTGKADTSGVVQNVSIIGTKSDDVFYLNDTVQAGDSINGNDGTDTLVAYQGGVVGTVSKVENIDVQMRNASVTLDFDKLPDAVLQNVRNISSNNAASAPADIAGDQVATFNNLTAAQAANLTIQHSTTFNNAVEDTTLVANLKTDAGVNDLVSLSINEGTNTDARFNFTLDNVVAGVKQNVESVTLKDNDTESNSVELNNFAKHTGTVTLSGGLAGTFLNLDVDTAGGDVTAALNATTADAGEIQQGLYALDTTGTTVDASAGHIFDVSGVATQVRLRAATVDASAEVGNVIVRLDTNYASATGAQKVTMGSGNDTVIFDRLNDTRAGLTIADTVAGGTGTDTLVIDGSGVRISIGSSEWTNVSGFENLRLVGTTAAPVSTLLGDNAYNLTLTNDFIQANGSGLLNILNDNDASNDVKDAGSTAGTAVESGVTIDARSLNAQNHFTYNGEEGASRTADRFIFTDANINGGNVIDGGAVDNLATTFNANADIIEIRNNATATAGDLENISNIGIIAGVNDQAVTQTLDLELTDTVIDALVDSYHASSTTQIEKVTVRLNSAADIGGPVAGMALKLDASSLTSKSAADVALDSTFNVADSIQVSPSGGLLTISGFNTAAAAGTDDKIVLSLSKFTLIDAALGGTGLSTVAGGLNAGDFNSSGVFVSAATSVIAQEIVFDQTTGDLYYNLDGAVAGGLVKIATLTGVTDLAVADFTLIA
ncbi:beta strand repeat-containing protein [Noviherbaspirillum aerium]|uniref:beta strand repeat-containing protein n=1 Tax=Noviherbaspirillum aerium TaxID=2588497 RepID=UPI00124F497D|nr:hypothetical protein [Noviherbaspirillum aerium]